ncbi:hypothetical protein D3C76_1123930 [compost metagenome]
MRIDASEVLKNAFNNLIQRNASQLQLQDFINRSRRYHAEPYFINYVGRTRKTNLNQKLKGGFTNGKRMERV